MDELKQQLIDKLGIDEALADTAITLVLGYVKDKLPENLQGPIEQIANGETPDLGETALDAVKGFFS